jgi:hypothetical protein
MAAVEDDEDANNKHHHLPPDFIDYFDVFHIPHTYDVDFGALKQKYLNLMTLFHPDRQHSLSDVELLQKEQQHLSNLSPNDITNAYQMLTEGHTRACHLLEIYGHPILESSPKAEGGGCGPYNGKNVANSSELVGMDFLMDMMEWRERIESLALCTPQDGSDGPCSCGSDDKNKELQDIWNETQAYQKDCEEQLKLLWKDGWDENDTTKIQNVRKLSAQLQYWHRLETALREEMDVV